MRTNNVESCYQSRQTGFFIYATCCQAHMSWECSHIQADINRIWGFIKLELWEDARKLFWRKSLLPRNLWMSPLYLNTIWFYLRNWISRHELKVFKNISILHSGKIPTLHRHDMVGIPSPFCKYQLKQCIAMHFVTIHSNDPNYFVKKELEGHSIYRL